MPRLVTIGVPVYKRLNYLPQALAAVRAQDYPAIELIVSDNGQNGEAIAKLVEEHYGRPYRLRQNPVTVPIATHFNQLVAAASGEYFVVLGDDDEISPNFASALVRAIEQQPDVAVALARGETMDQHGHTLPPSIPKAMPTALMSAREFIYAWCRHEYNFVSFTTNLTRTAEIRAVGGYLHYPSGNLMDNALLVKVCLERMVALVSEATLRKRKSETSAGFGVSVATLAHETSQFLQFLDSDPDLQRYALAHPAVWHEIRDELRYMAWYTYLGRWQTMYRRRMGYGEWVRAGFSLPWIPAYYAEVVSSIIYSSRITAAVARGVKRVAPWAYRAYQSLKYRLS